MTKPKSLGGELIEIVIFYSAAIMTLLATGQLPNEPDWNAVGSIVRIVVIVLIIVYCIRSVHNAYREGHPKEAHHQ